METVGCWSYVEGHSKREHVSEMSMTMQSIARLCWLPVLFQVAEFDSLHELLPALSDHSTRHASCLSIWRICSKKGPVVMIGFITFGHPEVWRWEDSVLLYTFPKEDRTCKFLPPKPSQANFIAMCAWGNGRSRAARSCSLRGAISFVGVVSKLFRIHYFLKDLLFQWTCWNRMSM